MNIRRFFRHLFASNADQSNSEPKRKSRKGAPISGAIGFGQAWAFNDFESPRSESEDLNPADHEGEGRGKHSDD